MEGIGEKGNGDNYLFAWKFSLSSVRLLPCLRTYHGVVFFVEEFFIFSKIASLLAYSSWCWFRRYPSSPEVYYSSTTPPPVKLYELPNCREFLGRKLR